MVLELSIEGFIIFAKAEVVYQGMGQKRPYDLKYGRNQMFSRLIGDEGQVLG